MLRFPNTLSVIFGAKKNTVRSSGFSRSTTGRDTLKGEPPKGGTPNGLSRVSPVKPKHCNCMELSFVFISSGAKHSATSIIMDAGSLVKASKILAPRLTSMLVEVAGFFGALRMTASR